MIYLIEYDAKAGQLVAITEFPPLDRPEAEDIRLTREIELLKEGVCREVVVLDAMSEEDLRKTHRRYFETVKEIGGQ